MRGKGLVKTPPPVWQARLVDLPQPDPGTPHLADVIPSVLSAMGVAGFEGRIPLPVTSPARACCSSMGSAQSCSTTYAAEAPVMAGLRGRTLAGRVPVHNRRRARGAGHRLPLG